MSQFRDSTGKEWTVRITVGRLQKIRTLAGIDLRKAEAWADLGTDIEKAAAVAWAAADGPASGVTLDAFLDRLADVKQCAEMCEAVVAAARDFFLTPPDAGGTDRPA